MEIDKLLESAGTWFAGDETEAALHSAHLGLDRALARIRRPRASIGVIDSPLGDLLVATSDRGVLMVHFMDNESLAAAEIVRLRAEFDPVEGEAAVEPIAREIGRYLAGDEEALRQPVDLSLAANPFQRKVLRRLLTVPRGAVISYRALAAAAGAPAAARAVGNALHTNPVAIYVPCHRVITSDGRIGGYAGGIERKLKLLRSEGFAIDRSAARIPEGIVWGHRGTKIYCRTSCYTTAKVDRTRVLYFADPAKARYAGLRACKICRPA